MRLHFPAGELLLYKNESDMYVLEQHGVTVATYRSGKKAVAEYNGIRALLEKEMPPAEMTDEDRKKLLAEHIADGLVHHNSLRQEPKKKPAKSRTFG